MPSRRCGRLRTGGCNWAMSGKNRWKAGIGPLLLLVVIFFGPHCIHLFYHLMTPDAVIATKRLDYAELAAEEGRLSPKSQEASIKKRHALFLWFHARGLNIDEGDEAQSIWHPWNELMEYWKSGSD